ncbi:hypothetical protein B0F90DRAFT_1033470 [Multifurca ochricompacta]|uniref:Uncharacterized protein n=1 Tax=Multifurca ochricompacta TaxID=376703 RepID=A0AAD4M144_9AGAM|nr:hypothetical protein B0F90DRAFT_1033470 [Multifurca ochricompacta]
MTDLPGLDMGLELLSTSEDTLVTQEEPPSGAGRSTTTGADGKSDDQRTVSAERGGGISTRGGGEGIENPSSDDGLDDGSLGYIVPCQACGIGPLGTINSGRGTGGFTIRPEGVENVSIEDVDGDDPLGGVRPKDGMVRTPDEGVRHSVIVERWVRRIDPTTDSVSDGAGCGDVTAGGTCGGSMMGTEGEGVREPNSTCGGGKDGGSSDYSKERGVPMIERTPGKRSGESEGRAGGTWDQALSPCLSTGSTTRAWTKMW